MTETDSRRLAVQVDAKSCPSPHSRWNQLGRVIWWIACTFLFRPSPRIFHGWRRLILRCLGARIGRNVRIDPTVRIWAPWNLKMDDESTMGHHVDCYNVASIHIGAHATVSQYAFLCTASHDVTDPHMKLISAPIVVGSQAWVCAGAYLAPGVQLHSGAVAAARSVVLRDVAEWMIVGGNPAREIKPRVLNSGIDFEE